MTPVEQGPVLFKHAAIIGFGNLGSSVARALRKSATVGGLTASDLSADVLYRAKGLGLAERYETDPATAVQGADLVVICSPISTYAAILDAIGPALT